MTRFSPELADQICAELAKGRSLSDICSDADMPSKATVVGWALNDYKGFSEQYARAREIGYHLMADEILGIADDGRNDWMERNGDDDKGWVVNGEHVQRSRIRLDTRKWMLSKVLPKIYGDRLDVNHGGQPGNQLPSEVKWVLPEQKAANEEPEMTDPQ